MDGIEIGSDSDSENIEDSTQMVIGQLTPTDASRMFQGTLDEVRIWNTARSQTEIQESMYTSLSSFESGLVAYYKFDQDSGTEVVDLTSFDHDGTLNGGPSWVASSVFGNITPPGNAMSFDGTDDYVQIPSFLDLGSTAFSVETWFKLDSLPSAYQMLVAQVDGTFWLYIPNQTGKLRTYLGGSSLNGVTSLSADVWYHAAVTYDGATLYLNGELEASASGTTTNATGDLLLGIHSNMTSKHLHGSLDEVRIWNVARSQTEIQASMNSALSGSESGLLTYYNFDDVGTSITNVTGSSHNGTLNGDTSWVISTVPMN